MPLLRQVFLDRMTDDPTANCAAEYWRADRWFSAWQGGDMARNEMEIIANQARAPVEVGSRRVGRVKTE
jgi:hypothetical protein